MAGPEDGVVNWPAAAGFPAVEADQDFIDIYLHIFYSLAHEIEYMGKTARAKSS